MQNIENQAEVERPITRADLSEVEQQELFAAIRVGLDIDQANQAFEQLKSQMKEQGEPPVKQENIYHQIKCYSEAASPEARAAHDQLMERHVGLVTWLASRFANQAKRHDFDDLYQEAWVGLSKAIWTYDPSKGATIATYSVRVMKNHIHRTLARADYVVSVPDYVYAEANSLRRHEPAALERAAQTGEYSELKKLTRSPKAVVSFDQNFRYGNGYDQTNNPSEYFDNEGQPTRRVGVNSNLDELLITDTHELESEMIEHEIVMTGIANYLLDGLMDREKTVLSLRFGLVTGEQLTLEEVGKVLGVTRERTRQIEAKAMSKMRVRAAKTHGFNGADPFDTTPTTSHTINRSSSERRDSEVERKFGLLRQFLPTIHAWGEFKSREYELEYNDQVVPIKLDPNYLMLALADELPSYVSKDGDGRFYGSEAAAKRNRQKIGLMPNLRIPEVAEYMEYFTSSLCVILENHRFGTPAQSHSGLIRSSVYDFIISERLASSELFKKALARKNDLI